MHIGLFKMKKANYFFGTNFRNSDYSGTKNKDLFIFRVSHFVEVWGLTNVNRID